MRIAITGSSGLIGTALASQLVTAGHTVVPVVRRAVGADEVAIRWDPDGGTIDSAGLDGIDAVVHLAGAGIGDHRWSAARKQVIRESRTRGTALLAEALAGLARPPAVLVSGSAIGYYGDRGDEILTETSAPGDDFLAGICTAWEAAAAPAGDAGVRVAHIRTGIVTTTAGGALPKLLPLFKLGLGGRFGSGRQWWSWITRRDVVRAIEFLLANDVHGPVNLTAPAPVTNREFSAALGRALSRPNWLPVPAFGPKLIVGPELAQALLFTSARVQPTVLEGAGFTFEDPDLATALEWAIHGEAA